MYEDPPNRMCAAKQAAGPASCDHAALFARMRETRNPMLTPPHHAMCLTIHAAQLEPDAVPQAQRHSQRGNADVLWGLQAGHVPHTPHHFVGHWVIDAIVAVLDVLVCKLARSWHLVPVRALSTTLALPLGEERAHARHVALQGAQ